MAKFQVHARVLDLLGEEQIADCPTAISELFKNAYDAYAERTVLDVYPGKNAAVLWDDGTGMDEETLVSKWLAIGTPSKKDLSQVPPPPEGVAARPLMGEKGIGRLAVSTLGDTLLIVAKKRASPYAALLINWNVVRNPQLMLSDIDVPTRKFESVEALDHHAIEDMLAEFRESLCRASRKHLWESPRNAELLGLILGQLDTFAFDASILQHSGLSSRGAGTAFYVAHIKPELMLYTEGPSRYSDDEEEPNLQLVQLLSNFQNHLSEDAALGGQGAEDPSGNVVAAAGPRFLPFAVDIRRWDPSTSKLRSIFQDWEAINTDDLKLHDHYFDIHFDAKGRFSGTVEIFGKRVDLRPIEAQKDRDLSCGPFHLRLWYVQGLAKESRLSDHQFTRIEQKLSRFGGLLVFRDGLRVLPYGRPEFDWLKFEERRNRKAGKAIFAYRRMFGYVEIARGQNPRLQDKAGREGLIANLAYRDFRRVLIDFFVQVARDHFWVGTDFHRQKEELSQREELLRREETKRKARRKSAADDLRKRLDSIREADAQVNEVVRLGLGAISTIAEGDTAGLANTVVGFQDRIAQMESQARRRVPKDVALSRSSELRQVIAEYQQAQSHLAGVVDSARAQFASAVRGRFPDADQAADRYRALRDGYRRADSRVSKAYEELTEAVGAAAKSLHDETEDIAGEIVDRVADAFLRVTETESVDKAMESKAGEVSSVLEVVDQAATDAVQELFEIQERVVAQLRDVTTAEREEVGMVQTEEIENLREKVQRNLELVQLGLSVEIIDHELNKLYRGIRNALADLKPLVQTGTRAKAAARNLEVNFQHLEQRYKMMSPLYRGSNRIKSELSGVRIRDHVNSFLARDMREMKVEFECTAAFLELAIVEVAAVVLPIFVNLADNAIYWLRDEPVRRLVFDRVGDVVTVCDTGRGIHESMLEEVFELFVSTKPNGRGLGLYIARANLELSKHEIWATNDASYRSLKGACFCIRFHPSSFARGGK